MMTTTTLAQGLFGHEQRMRRSHVVQLSGVRCDVAIDFYTVSRAAQRFRKCNIIIAAEKHAQNTQIENALKTDAIDSINCTRD